MYESNSIYSNRISKLTSYKQLVQWGNFLFEKTKPASQQQVLHCVVCQGGQGRTPLGEADIYLSLSYTLYLRSLIIYKSITLPVV